MRLLLLAIASSFLMMGCEQDGPAEEAGESIDEAVDDAGDALDDAGDEIEDEYDDATD